MNSLARYRGQRAALVVAVLALALTLIALVGQAWAYGGLDWEDITGVFTDSRYYWWQKLLPISTYLLLAAFAVVLLWPQIRRIALWIHQGEPLR